MLNKRQRDFAEYYIQCGNASEAARMAGYSENTAGDANKWLNPKKPQKYKPELAQYITDRLEALQKQKIATADEVVVFFTSVLRGEKQGNEIPSIKHRMEAGKEILKRVGAVDTEDTDALFGEAGLK